MQKFVINPKVRMHAARLAMIGVAVAGTAGAAMATDPTYTAPDLSAAGTAVQQVTASMATSYAPIIIIAGASLWAVNWFIKKLRGQVR